MKLNTLRWKLLKSYIYSGLFSSILVFLCLQAWYVFNPGSSELSISILVPLLTAFFVIITGGYFGYKDTQSIKDRLEDISTYIKVLSRGKLSERIEINEEDELGNIMKDLNQLAEKIKKQVSSLQTLADQKAQLAEKARGAAIIAERQRLARDLHDAVSQQLFALNMLSSAAIRLVDRDVETAKEQIKEVAEIASKAQAEMRALLLHLRPIHLSDDTLCSGVTKLAEELAKKSGVTFINELEEIPGLSKGIEENLFRVIQEGIGNALRHADATTIKIALYEKNDRVHLQIRDNGKGFDISNEKKGSYGLGTMQERCNEVGGEMTITSKENEGTFLDIRIPIK
ncbi:HAMP domain-containing sensor histidine kinase [Pseudalkalibacillus caeni]|uniref:histidine kinase n=1 Tax=Exobacillus caeni TaxID=2574798 RepID=A0A5R9F9C2_9BACL|nr:sensor histidine kinase [Pseudalkalibacillus caeni]TLS38876.1 sensor histidine kinase [Pseudalkalibacillus caeni]